METEYVYSQIQTYQGSRIFEKLAENLGLSNDLINFLITQLLALVLASVFRSHLHPSKVPASVRHAFSLILGLVFGYFCFGYQAVHIAGLPAVCYIILRTQNPLIVQRIIMVTSVTYLSLIHLHRQYYDYGSGSLDITGPLMIITQKVTSLAFSIHDGLTDKSGVLTTNQRNRAVYKMPSILEFFSYVLHFQGLMAGPLVFYNDYIDFIEGYTFKKYATTDHMNGASKQIFHEPSPRKAVVKKVLASLLCAYIFIKFVTAYPIKRIKDDEFLNDTSFLYKMWFIMVSTTVVRFKYYFAWLLADAICNNSGLGFKGYDRNGKPLWDLVTTIHIFNFEVGTNFRDCINAWNIGTNHWLRHIVYDRVAPKYGTILTFSLSALWHGFYPGYYLTFATGALNVMAARTARRLLRQKFQKTILLSRCYDIATVLTTRFFMGYATFPFVILECEASVRVYLKMYMCLHVVALFTIFLLPKIMDPNRNLDKKPKKNEAGLNESNAKIKLSNVQNKFYELDKGQLPSETFVFQNNLSFFIQKKIENETRNIEKFIDKTVHGIVELKEDLMRVNDNQDFTDEIRNRKIIETNSVDNFFKKEIEAINTAVQSNVVPAILSNGHAK